jgi:hypothetical protein
MQTEATRRSVCFDSRDKNIENRQMIWDPTEVRDVVTLFGKSSNLSLGPSLSISAESS